MIDTIKLNLDDCEIDNKAQIIIEPSPYTHDTQQKFINYDLFLDNTTGEIVQGKKAYLNNEKFNITIKPKYKLQKDAISKKRMYDINYSGGIKAGKIFKIESPEEKFNSGIFVQLSLPRYLNETNFNSISINDEKKVINQLEKDLRSNGIKTNIWNSNLSRVDAFANIQTDENFSSYSEIFSLINLSRMERFEYAGTTFLYKNGEQQICCYDKIAEIQNKFKKDTNFKLPNTLNVLRIENRLLKKRKIFSVTGFYTLKELYKNYDFIKEHYKNEVEKTIFQYEPEELEILTSKNIKNEMELFKNIKGRNWLHHYLRMYGLAHLLKLSNIETLYAAIDEIELFDRMKKSRLKKQLREMQIDIQLMKKNHFSRIKSNRELYNELKTKFYKAVA